MFRLYLMHQVVNENKIRSGFQPIKTNLSLDFFTQFYSSNCFWGTKLAQYASAARALRQASGMFTWFPRSACWTGHCTTRYWAQLTCHVWHRYHQINMIQIFSESYQCKFIIMCCFADEDHIIHDFLEPCPFGRLWHFKHQILQANVHHGQWDSLLDS